MFNDDIFEFSYVIEIVKKRFLWIIVFALFGIGGALLYNSISPIVYESKTTLYVEPQVNSNVVNYEGILTNQRMVKTYIQILKSRKIIEKVNENLKLKLTYNEILDMLTVTEVGDTEMISIVVRTNDYKKATLIANEITESFIQQLNEDMGITNIAVIDKAIENSDPVSPNIIKNLALGLIGGIMIGVIIIFIIDSLDNKIKNHEDVKKYLRINTLGVIPNYSNDLKNKTKKRKLNIKSNIKMFSNPNSITSESIKMLRTNLNFLDLKVINILSTVPSEGKSEVLTNLAASFALLDKKILVIDCDLRKPKVHHNFGLPRKTGVSDIVLGKGNLIYKKHIQKYVDPESKVEVDILSAGSKISNPSELINKDRFKKLIENVKEEYDLVLIDCPPISSMTDGVVVSHLCDGTIYVIESDRTDYHVISNCIEELKNNKVFLLGVVLTKVDVKHQKKLYGYKYDYYTANYNK